MKSLRILFCLSLISMMAPNLSFAKRGCSSKIARTTTYYTPEIVRLCGKNTMCSRFKSEVLLQGSGLIGPRKLLSYTGEVKNLGDCPTTMGAAGTCMKPYFTVAADPRYFSMGDIIEMPGLRGLVVNIGGGKKVIHPGYLIVEDTGGAIKGNNRFDIYTGAHNMMTDSVNPNLMNLGITDKSICSSDLEFSVIRKNTKMYAHGLAMIQDTLMPYSPKVALDIPGVR